MAKKKSDAENTEQAQDADLQSPVGLEIDHASEDELSQDATETESMTGPEGDSIIDSGASQEQETIPVPESTDETASDETAPESESSPEPGVEPELEPKADENSEHEYSAHELLEEIHELVSKVEHYIAQDLGPLFIKKMHDLTDKIRSKL